MPPEETDNPMHEPLCCRQRYWTVAILMLVAIPLAACSVSGGAVINLMPPPEALASDETSPFSDDRNVFQDVPYRGVLYATNREPAAAEDTLHYSNERGGVVRLGVARVALGEGEIDWEEARRIHC